MYVSLESVAPTLYPSLANDPTSINIWPKDSFLKRLLEEDLSKLRTSFKITPFHTLISGTLSEANSLYIEASFAEFSAWFHGKTSLGDGFAKLPLNASQEVSIYAGYKHFEVLFEDSPSLSSFFPFASLLSPSSKVLLDDDSNNKPTLWLSTMNAYTPLHYDSYGCNIIVQLVGTKRWKLWRPQRHSLPPTRIPYEESTVFSTYDPLKALNNSQNNMIPADFEIELSPGDVLFVPKHYWHFVTTTSSIALSVNLWLPCEDDDQDRCREAMVRFAMTSFMRTLKISCGDEEIAKYLSPSETGTLNPAGRSIGETAQSDDDREEDSSHNGDEQEAVMALDFVRESLKALLIKSSGGREVNDAEVEVRVRRMVDAFLAPEKIERVMSHSLA